MRTLLGLLALLVCLQGALAADEQLGYHLYPGDLLDIRVFDHPDLSVQIRVPVDGVISFPLIGEVREIVGRDIGGLSAILRERLEDGYLRQAIITATVLEFGPRRAVVMGSVEHPGAVHLNPYATTTAMQAIGQVGGFRNDANRGAAVVIRAETSGMHVALPLPAVDEPEALVNDVVLRPSDIVIVPRLDRVYIIGEVRNPGAVNLPSFEALTVSKAISLVGGFARFARTNQVQVISMGGSTVTVDVRSILAGRDGEEDVVLKPGDTIYVPESRF